MAEIRYEPCKGEHLRYIEAQAFQAQEQLVLLTPDYVEIITSNVALSAWVNNRCIGAGGIIPVFPHRAVAWALLSKSAGTYMLPITRKIRRFLDLDPTPRIEMTVAVDFEEGHRWAKAIGLSPETGVLRKHGAGGGDEIMYARIK